jgi:tetratricopeptide (TPR) repeat protein
MFRLVRASVLVLAAFAPRLSLAQEVGDPVVVLRDTPIKRDKEILQTLHAGELLRVEAVDGDWLWVSSEQTGWAAGRNLATPKEAIDFFSELIAENEDDVDALVARGNARLADRQSNEAIADFEEALGVDPKHVAALVGRAHALAEKRLPDRALTDLEKALELDPQRVDALFLRGVLLAEGGRLGHAAADLSQCLGLSPEHAAAYRARAGVWLEMRDLDRAFADANLATELDPRSSTAMVTRGTILLSAGKWDEGVADLNEALRIDPSDHHAFLARGQARLQKKEFRQADADYSTAIKIHPDPQTFTLRGDIRMEMKEFDKAIADYSAALKLKRDDTHALHGRSTARMCKQDYVQALADVTEIMRIDPNDVPARWRRAFIRAAAPNASLRDGKQAVADAVFACDRTQWKQAEPVSVLAAAYAELGDFDKAIEWETKAIKLTTDKGLISELRTTLKLYQQHKPFRLGGDAKATAQVENRPPTKTRTAGAINQTGGRQVLSGDRK